MNQPGDDDIIPSMKLFFVLVILFFLSSCSLSPSQAQKKTPTFKPWSEVTGSTAPGTASGYDEIKLLGNITDPALPEISGIVASQRNPGIFWVHNDSGDQAKIYAINDKGKLLAQATVPGAQNVDWEDIAIAPGSDGQPVLFLADSGDNNQNRDDQVVYRIHEPKLSGSNKFSTEPAEAFPFRFPDGHHDCEAIFINPQNGQIYLITKTKTEDCGVYRFPLPLRPGARVVLEKIGGKNIQKIQQLRLVTGASNSPDGTHIAIRTYFAAFEFQRDKSAPFEALFNDEPMTIKVPLMRQAEAIGYTADGKSLVTTSEKLPAPLYLLSGK